jgi:hypothetical protein
MFANAAAGSEKKDPAAVTGGGRRVAWPETRQQPRFAARARRGCDLCPARCREANEQSAGDAAVSVDQQRLTRRDTASF